MGNGMTSQCTVPKTEGRRVPKTQCRSVPKTAGLRRRAGLTACLTGAGFFFVASGLLAADPPPSANPATKTPSAANAPATLSVTVDSLHLGSIYSYYNPSAGTRFLAVRLNVTNRGSQPVAIRAQDVVLHCDGTDFKLKEPVGGLRTTSFQVRRSHDQGLEDAADGPFANRAREDPLTNGWSSAGCRRATRCRRWCCGSRRTERRKKSTSIEAGRQELKLTVERIGPRGCLALLTVAGELNTVNAGSLVGTLESLVAQKVVRAVIRFQRSAPRLDGQMLSWLQQGAVLAGRGENNNVQLPGFPMALRELHLAALPNRVSENLEGAAGDEPRIHRRESVAVRAALKTADRVAAAGRVARRNRNREIRWCVPRRLPTAEAG